MNLSIKLYYAPHTCSLSPHIVLRELGLPFTLVKVDNKTKRTADGRDFRDINPKGYVAALELADGEVLTEGPAIVQYLADLVPEAALAPASGTLARVRLQEWLNFITSEIHGGSAWLFHDALDATAKGIVRERLFRRMAIVETRLASHAYLLGESFSVADAYLFTVLTWFAHFGIDLSPWPATAAWFTGIARRPAVRAAREAEVSG